MIIEGKIVNVFTGRIQNTSLFIEDGIIKGMGDYYNHYKGLDCFYGGYILPGFIDGHIHIESSLLKPSEFAKIAIKHGTTTVICDCHEIANVKGLMGIDFMMMDSKDTDVDIFFTFPSCVPAVGEHLEGARHRLASSDMSDYINRSRIVGLAEIMDFPSVIGKDKDMLAKINITKLAGKVVDGHAPFLSGIDLDKYLSAGIESDHECLYVGEAMEKLSKGMWIMIREGSLCKNMESLIPIIDEYTVNRCMFVTDDIMVDELIKGHLDVILKKAVELEVDPINAIKMVTINPANYFGLKDRGAIAVGRKADLVFVEDLIDFKVTRVMKNGSVIEL